jgi:hypothetical protein
MRNGQCRFGRVIGNGVNTKDRVYHNSRHVKCIPDKPRVAMSFHCASNGLEARKERESSIGCWF